MATAVKFLPFEDGLYAVIAALEGDAEVGFLKVDGAHIRLSAFRALLGFQIENDESRLCISG